MGAYCNREIEKPLMTVFRNCASPEFFTALMTQLKFLPLRTQRSQSRAPDQAPDTMLLSIKKGSG
jgi:hypothetical protein